MCWCLFVLRTPIHQHTWTGFYSNVHMRCEHTAAYIEPYGTAPCLKALPLFLQQVFANRAAFSVAFLLILVSPSDVRFSVHTSYAQKTPVFRRLYIVNNFNPDWDLISRTGYALYYSILYHSHPGKMKDFNCCRKYPRTKWQIADQYGMIKIISKVSAS